MPGAKISALGCHVPAGVLTNHDLEKIVETNDQWIVERTGISERHIATADIATSDMAVEAARVALAARGIDAGELDAIIVCTVTPDMFFPATACLVQDRIGAHGAWGFDLVAACSGFIYGLTTAAHFVMAGTHKKVLVIGADTMSRILDYTDRSTCILFGDAAGAMLVETAEEGEGFIGFRERDRRVRRRLSENAGRRQPHAFDQGETVEQRMHFVKQDGGQVFKYAVRKMEELCIGLLEKHDLTPKDVKLLIPHQANRRIILGGRGTIGDGSGASDHQYRPVWEHDGRDDSFGDAGCGGVGEIAKRGFSVVRGGGSGVYGGGEFVAVGVLGSAC